MTNPNSIQIQKDQLLESFFLNTSVVCKKMEDLHLQHQCLTETEHTLLKSMKVKKSLNSFKIDSKPDSETQNTQHLEETSSPWRKELKFPYKQGSDIQNTTLLGRTLDTRTTNNYQYLKTTELLSANEKRSLALEKPKSSFARDRIYSMQTQMLQNQILITPTDLTMTKLTPSRQIVSHSDARRQLNQYSPYHKVKHRKLEQELSKPILPTIKQLNNALCGVRAQLIKNKVDVGDCEIKFTKMHRAILNNLRDADNLFAFLNIERRIKSPRQIIKQNFQQLLEPIYKFFINISYCRFPRPRQLYFGGDNLGYDCSFLIFAAALSLILEDYEPIWQENAFFPMFIRGTDTIGPYTVNV